MRVVIVAHSHPTISRGGGEVAAHNFFRQLRHTGTDAHFVGLTIRPADKARLFVDGETARNVGPCDHHLRGGTLDNFTMEYTDLAQEDELLEFLLSLEADVYHFHHYWNIGAGTIRRLRLQRPDAVMLCTLHEYTAICANHGQMIKTGSGALCHEASTSACAACFPERSELDFFIRYRRMLNLLETFDKVFAPSMFLAQRFRDWGLSTERIEVLENGIPRGTPFDGAAEATGRRFAFFGQATRAKGLHVLARATELLASDCPDLAFSVDVHGVSADEFSTLWPDLAIPDRLRFNGRYEPGEVIPLMAGYDWIILPSVWWENAPLVIDEARAAGTPVITSDIGGMLERSRDFGLHFETGNSRALAEVMQQVCGDTGRHSAQKSRITPPLYVDEYATRWFEILDRLSPSTAATVDRHPIPGTEAAQR